MARKIDNDAESDYDILRLLLSHLRSPRASVRATLWASDLPQKHYVQPLALHRLCLSYHGDSCSSGSARIAVVAVDKSRSAESGVSNGD